MHKKIGFIESNTDERSLRHMMIEEWHDEKRSKVVQSVRKEVSGKIEPVIPIKKSGIDDDEEEWSYAK